MRREFLCGNLRRGACTCLTRLGSCSSFWCIPCWRYQNPSWTKLGDETPTRPYIGRTHIVDIVHPCTARLWNEWSSVSFGRLRSGSFYDRRMCGARPRVLPSSYSRLLYQLSYRGIWSSRNGWIVAKTRGEKKHTFSPSYMIKRRNPRFRLHPTRRRCFPRPRRHSAWPT